MAGRPPKVDAFRIDYSLAAVGELGHSAEFGEGQLLRANWLDASIGDAVPLDGQSAALQIEYPHPQKGADAALATLKVYEPRDGDPRVSEEPRGFAAGRWMRRLNPFHRGDVVDDAPLVPREIVTLEISRTQFELLMSDLHRETYVAETPKKFLPAPSGDVALSILHNRQLLHRSSIAEPRLDEFMRRVYRDGEVLLGQREPNVAIVTTSVQVVAPDPDWN